MILFKDNRAYGVPFNKRLEIAAIYHKPLGKHFVEITEDWYKNPVIPLDINPKGILSPFVLSSSNILKAYVEEMAKERNMAYPLYLSIFEDNVAEMDKRYKQQSRPE